MALIPRALAQTVAKATPPKAVAIFGPRRIGKTTMLEQLVGTKAARWYNGDAFGTAEALRFKTPEDAKNALLQAPALVIDEAHKIPDIGNIVKLLVDVNEHLERPTQLLTVLSFFDKRIGARTRGAASDVAAFRKRNCPVYKLGKGA